ncbi:Myotubularin-related protein 3 [Triplophysa tibetana]|uniref:Myotubularin-related protein 3 n=1 Tax=Triplophysa tibetana TaxID=1572043 RepID=A0A5A9MX06_9TELE|nr:Myotubularin-related protein 3 [Triplophysa tibetana]
MDLQSDTSAFRHPEDSVDSSSSDDSNVSAGDQTSDVSEDVKHGSFTSAHDDRERACGVPGVNRRPSLNGDAVQVRLRQTETGNLLQVDMLKLQKLWSRLHVNGKLTSLPDAEHNMESGCLARCGTEALSESSWQQMEEQDSEVTQWYSDHPASRCYGCERRFWRAARTHHCSGREAVEEDWNCGNVFCTSCCDQKAAQNQQLCELKRACQTCTGTCALSCAPRRPRESHHCQFKLKAQRRVTSS